MKTNLRSGLQTLLALSFCWSVQAQINTKIFTVVPAASTNLVGSDIQLSVLENGLPPVDQLDYQWFKDRTNLVDGGNISGSQTATLTITNAALTNAGTYVASLSVSNVV